MFEDETVLGRMVRGLAKAMAVAGGLALVAMTILVIISIIGRTLTWAGLKPILGDYELVEIGMGFAVFAFLPWVHLDRGHAMVTLVTDSFSTLANAIILIVTDLLMLVAGGFIAWRLYDGMLDKFRYGETTLLLRLPLGWAYALGLAGAVTLALVAAFVLARSVTRLLTGRFETAKRDGAPS